MRGYIEKERKYSENGNLRCADSRDHASFGRLYILERGEGEIAGFGFHGTWRGNDTGGAEGGSGGEEEPAFSDHLYGQSISLHMHRLWGTETGGYSIAVDALYLTETNICAGTSLLGPEPSEKSNKTPSYPYIVLKTEYMEQTVLFE